METSTHEFSIFYVFQLLDRLSYNTVCQFLVKGPIALGKQNIKKYKKRNV